MKIFLAVIDELYVFAIESLFRREKIAQKSVLEESYTQNQDYSKTDIVDDELDVIDLIPEFQSIGDIAVDIENHSSENNTVTPTGDVATNVEQHTAEKNVVMYIGGSDTPLYINPTREFDSVLARLPYGAMVMVLGHKGRWTNVAFDTLNGWVLRDDLLDRAAYVYPHFVVGEQNTVEDTNTIRIRAMLDDTFSGALADLDLQPAEYVQYRLMRKGITLPWSDLRPRTQGTWHQIFRGAQGIHSGIVPKTGAVMEYMQDEDNGQLAFVEAVFPDETIDISEINYGDGSIYNERTLTKDEWKELKPIFIQAF